MANSNEPAFQAIRDQRRYSHPVRHADERSAAARDRDRILYSSALRRLARVTQVVSPDERQILHNRLTHSLEVAQIGRGLAGRLQRYTPEKVLADIGGLDPFVVEAASLAHDLGHPPFGHVAESELNRLLVAEQVADGFEGNAQSFRIVNVLSARYSDTAGLNLTRATLSSILKYPWTASDPRAQQKNKWGAYDSEAGTLNWAVEWHPDGGQTRSLEAALMDWADDIAYAVHDMEDFVRAGLIPLDRLTQLAAEREQFIATEFGSRGGHDEFDLPEASRVLDALMQLAPRGFDGSRFARAALRSFTSSLVNRYLGSVSIRPSGFGELSLRIDDEAVLEVKVLKGLTWHYVIRRNSLRTLRFGQRALIRDLFMVFMEAAANPADHPIFPRAFAESLAAAVSRAQQLRIVADVIASMSETQVVEVHQRLTGRDLGSALDEVMI